MCKGLGKFERFWLKIANSLEQQASGFKPWTFEEICRNCWDFDLTPSMKRSMHRALRSMVMQGCILRLSGYRYCVSPKMFSDGDPRKAALWQRLEGEEIYIIQKTKIEGAAAQH